MQNRINRINEEMKRELSDIIRRLKDPRIGIITSVIAVDVTKDMHHAKVFVSILGDENQQKDALKGLQNAAGFIRKEIGHSLSLRYTPEISFVLDHSIEYGAKINKILHDIGTDR